MSTGLLYEYTSFNNNNDKNRGNNIKGTTRSRMNGSKRNDNSDN